MGNLPSLDFLKISRKLCRLVTIETPALVGRRQHVLVLNGIVRLPVAPAHGARVRVVYAGACFRRSLMAGAAGVGQLGLRDGSLFAGFEVAGVIDQLGDEVPASSGYRNGQRVCVFTFAENADGYTEYFIVPDFRFLVVVPDELPLRVAAMLPSGALQALNAVEAAQQMAERRTAAVLRILIVGTGGLALWAIHLAMHRFRLQRYPTAEDVAAERVRLTVASLHDEGFSLACCHLPNVRIVEWHEKYNHRAELRLVERTRIACGGPADVIIDFGSTPCSVARSLRCLGHGGLMLLDEHVFRQMPRKFGRLAIMRDQRIRAVRSGSVEQLHELVALMASASVEPPPHFVYPVKDAPEVVERLCRSEIPGRAIFKF